MDIEIQRKIGEKIRLIRKQKKMSQKMLADLIGKSLRTVQFYEKGESQFSIAVLNDIAKALGTSTMFLMSEEVNDGDSVEKIRINTISDVIQFLFELEKMEGIEFFLNVKRPPFYDNWECSITFNGKDSLNEYNTNMCLILEDYAKNRQEYENNIISSEEYDLWKKRMLSYYSSYVMKKKEKE